MELCCACGGGIGANSSEKAGAHNSCQPALAGRGAKGVRSLAHRARGATARLPSELADAVAFVESAYLESAVGKAGEIGLMQIMPSTAAMLGFAGSLTQLAEPETNITYGVEYLAIAWRRIGQPHGPSSASARVYGIRSR